MQRSTGAIILAAGKGKRMKSDLPKVLHRIRQRPMILYVLEVAQKIVGDALWLVVGHQAEQVKKEVSPHFEVNFVMQQDQLGTGHAVKCALPQLPDFMKHVIVLCGDVPLINPLTLEKLLSLHLRESFDLTVLGVTVDKPTGYGRLIVDDCGKLSRIVEEADAEEHEKRIHVINSGIFCFTVEFLKKYLPHLKQDNKQKEQYLTDLVTLGAKDNCPMGMYMAIDSEECTGINSISELMRIEALMADRENKLS
jgi:bifunctional UDP-N-acetylglucosamine pyrophosphorylase/glucosamine-1-phosphate N-acetyltransferase/UDP-N-acetylglucosamine pyrophosphorylase